MEANDLLVVGIGASAGGIKAIKKFFEHVPPDSAAAYVVVLHLSPDHDSRLAEVLQSSATIPVTQVEHRVQVQPNHVYVIPPNQSLAINDGHLAVSDIAGYEERRAPVDIFFRTLAESHGPRAVCVVLSGTGANGSMGLKRVKERGGVCLVQSPEEAEYSDMPRNSIGTGLVDHVLPVGEIPGKIFAYKRLLETVGLPDTGAERRPTDEQALRDVFVQLRTRTGHDFSNYKRATVLRRIARRMGLRELTEVRSYARYLADHPDEAQALLKDLLISVTNFFRDREAFAALERHIIPKLFEGSGEDQVRVWVPGCATGEEAYSIAILLAEYGAGTPGSPSVQLFATDIDESAITIAREGVYTINDAADVSPERLRRFFTKEGEAYRVQKELREMVLFAHHNLIKDPPFSHLDLLSCRNLLIYLNKTAQRRALEVMHFALNPGRFLFLGTSESAEDASDLFVAFDKDAHVFQSRGVAPRVGLPVPELTVARRDPVRVDEDRDSELRARERLSAADLHQRLLEQYAPPSVVVNEDQEIVHLSERAGRYLQFSGGDPSHNLLKVVRPELRLELRTALSQAAQQRSDVEARNLLLRVDERTVTLNLVVRPVMRDGDPARGFFLVLFEETEAAVPPPQRSPTPISSGDAARQMEEEILRVKAQLRATVERHETQAEELKASNEELQAMNEELRSTTEELETSTEELQSVNEELRTVNQELKIKVEEQTQANEDIQNLINSTEIGTIFLDRGSRIKLFTPRACDIFNLIPADRGRQLSDISSLLVDVDLHADVERVLERLERVEREVKTRAGRWQLMRLQPYRTTDDRIDGVVLTFVDISGPKQLEELARGSAERLRLIIESISDHAIVTLDADRVIDSWNAGSSVVFGYTEQEILGQNVEVLFTPEDRRAGVHLQELAQARETGRGLVERWHLRKGGQRFYGTGVTSPLKDQTGAIVGFVKVTRDLTERKQFEAALMFERDALEERVRQRTSELQRLNEALDLQLHEKTATEERSRSLLRRLITVQEDERQRIARDLHDHLGQQVAGLGLKLSSLGQLAGGNEAVAAAVADVSRRLERLDRDLDFFTWELRPATVRDLGLVSTLRDYVGEWSRNFGILAEFQSDDLDGVKLDPEAGTNLYRIAQEALNNVYKHAKATRVGVILERRGSKLVLVVEDNGVGFDRHASVFSEDNRGIGLLGMSERAALVAGAFEVETAPGKGTSIFVQVPLESV